MIVGMIVKIVGLFGCETVGLIVKFVGLFGWESVGLWGCLNVKLRNF